MIELRFHSSEKSFPTPILPDELALFPTGYIAPGEEVRDKVHYEVLTFAFHYENCPEAAGRHSCFSKPQLHDIEYVSVYYLKKQAVAIYFSAHAPGQGTWIPVEKCKLNSRGDLIVYVAKHSHAMYPVPGTYVRKFGFANDHCSKKGKSIRLAYSDFIHAYDHTFDNGIALYKNLFPAPPSASITSWKRFFLPYYNARLRNGAIGAIPGSIVTIGDDLVAFK